VAWGARGRDKFNCEKTNACDARVVTEEWKEEKGGHFGQKEGSGSRDGINERHLIHGSVSKRERRTQDAW